MSQKYPTTSETLGKSTVYRLSSVDIQVLSRLNWSDAQIGKEFVLRPKTVGIIIQELMKITGARSRTELAMLALQESWITFDDLKFSS